MSCELNEKLFDKGDVVAVALSGGKDSMCLLNVLIENGERLGIAVKAINIEHGIRGESSVRDSEFVADYCKKRGVELKRYALKCSEFSAANGYSEEEGARIARYSCFHDALNGGFCDKVATAHHLSDSFETTLFNLFRGASVAGVSGISQTRDDGKIIRPFARVSKRDIDEYIQENRVPFVQDETNFQNEYSRNFIRNKVIPIILERFPEAEKSVGRFCELSERDNDYLNAEAEKSLFVDGYGAYLIKTDTPECLFSRAAVKALKALGIGKDYEKVHVDEISALRFAANSTAVNLPKGVCAAKEYDYVAIYKGQEYTCPEKQFAFAEFSEFPIVAEFIKEKYKPENFSDGNLYFDADKIPDGAVVRTARKGDVFTKFGGGTKKLNDYFTDKKIPLRLRDKLPLVCVQSEVLIVCGVEISDKIKIDENTLNVGKCKKLQKI